MGCGDADVQCVDFGLGRQRSSAKKVTGDNPAVVGDFQQRYVTEQPTSPASRSHIATPGFLYERDCVAIDRFSVIERRGHPYGTMMRVTRAANR